MICRRILWRNCVFIFDKVAQHRVFLVTITPSTGDRPDRLDSATEDIFRLTLDPGTVITFVLELRADHLNVLPKTRELVSEAAVTVTGPGSILRGHGLAVNLANKQYELESQVRARYDRPPR